MFDGYNTDKGFHHTYQETYEEICAPFKHTATAILELGVLHGGSLKAFRDYFPNARVYGMDCNPDCMVRGEPRINTVTGNVRSRADLKMCTAWGPYDLIVDDASHNVIDQFQALRILWPTVKPGGYYVVEDLELARNGHEFLGHVARMLQDEYKERNVILHLGDREHVKADDMMILRKEDNG